MKYYRRTLPLTAAAVAMSAGFAAAQTTWDSVNVPQPHLAAALALAAQENSWRHPGLVSCYWADGVSAQDVNKDTRGYKIFDNLYFVGSGKISVYAIDTSEGIILIDSMNTPAEVDKYILPNMKTVGLDPARLKTLISSHGHADHFGGGKYLVEKYHMRAYLSEVDWDLAEKTSKEPGYSRGMPPKRDMVVKDGDTITLGNESLKVYLTPGHSPGSLTNGHSGEGKGPTAAPGPLRRVANPLMLPETGRSYDAFEKSYARLGPILHAAKVDGYIAAHTNYDDAPFKIEVMRHNPSTLPNPFRVGTARVVLFTKMSRECDLNNADLHRAMPNFEGLLIYAQPITGDHRRHGSGCRLQISPRLPIIDA